MTSNSNETIKPAPPGPPNQNKDVVEYNDRDASTAASSEYDPFRARLNILENPVSDCGTLIHVIKASLGTGILSMPAAFLSAGLALGIVSTILVSIICTHCSYILVASAHEIYKKNRVPSMSFADTAKEACLRGPNCAKKLAPFAGPLILVAIFMTYFLTCSCYAVIVARSFNYVASYYLGYEPNLKLTISMLLVPFILLAYVPNLKYLAPVSLVAISFMAIGLGITLYYLTNDIPPISERNLVADMSTYPASFSITIYAIEAIGLIMPLENQMKNPKNFIGLCGVLNRGMGGSTVVYNILGFFGYLKYGEQTEGSITLNLPQDQYAAQVVNIVIGLAIFCSFGLKLYVCIDIVWNGIKERYSRKTLANYIMRTSLVILSLIIAIAVPTIIPFVSLIGALCFSILGLLCPVFIEMCTFWDKGLGKYNWKIYKNIVVALTGLFALIFGSKLAIEDIILIYAK